MIDLGDLLAVLGRFERARAVLDEALAIRRAAFGDDHPDTASAYGMAGFAAYKRGDWPAARASLEKALAVQKAFDGEESLGVASTLFNLGQALLVMNERGRPRCSRADAVDPPQAPGRRPPRHRLGPQRGRRPPLGLRRLGRRPLVLRAGPGGPPQGVRPGPSRHGRVAPQRRGDLARAPADTAKALSLIDQALKVEESRLGLDHPETGRTLLIRGIARATGGRLADARADFRRALEIQQHVYGPRSAVAALAWGQLGQVETARKDYPAARRCYESALAIQREALGGGHPAAVLSRGNIAYLAFLEKDYLAARRELESWLPLRVALTRDVLATLSEAEALAFVESSPGSAVFLSIYRNLPDGPDVTAAKAFEAVAATRAQATRLLAARRALARGNPATLPRRQRLAAVRGRLAELALSGTSADRFREEMTTLDREKEELERSLAREGSPTPATPAAPAAGPAELAARLPADVAVVELCAVQVIGPPQQTGGEPSYTWRYEAFVLRRGEAPERPRLTWVHLGPAEELLRAATNFRKAIADFSSGRAAAATPVDAPAAALRKGLWDPIEPHLVGCSTVVIIPDDTLTRIPWAALPGRTTGTYLVDDYALATAGHVEQIATLLGRGPSPGGSRLLVGGVDYGMSSPAPELAASVIPGPAHRARALVPGRRPDWPPLGATSDEIRLVAGLAPMPNDVQRLEAGAASEAALRDRLPGARFVHLATHGFFADEVFRSAFHIDPTRETIRLGGVDLLGRRSTVTSRNPLILSGVVLAGANRPHDPLAGGDDGIMTAEEVADLDLGANELVVLSACETGLGEVAGGEGVLGLQSAFHLAGARSVVASLWKIDDDATRAIMREFYAALWRDSPPAGKAQAIRRAQRAMIRGYDPAARSIPRGIAGFDRPVTRPGKPLHPYYWAAFTLYGDWR